MEAVNCFISGVTVCVFMEAAPGFNPHSFSGTVHMLTVITNTLIYRRHGMTTDVEEIQV